MKIDYHIHSEFSSDSRAKMEEIVELAIAKGYQEIAFSDHFDLLPEEIAYYGVPSYRQYSLKVKQVRERYPQIKILKGVEVGEYHRCFLIVDSILAEDVPDIKIGAIHVLPGDSNNEVASANISVPLKEEVSGNLIKRYYTENYLLVQKGGFDVLAHLGVYKRYLKSHPNEEIAADIIEEIFNLLISKQIALEVNLSGLRKNITSTVPSVELLRRYRQQKGELITIGSDTHHSNDFDVNYDDTVELLRQLGFKFQARKTGKGFEQVRL